MGGALSIIDRRLLIGLDRLVEPERRSFRIGPIGRCHPAVVAFDNGPMGAIVGRELYDGTAREAGRKLEDVPYRRAPEAVQALVLIADNTDVAGILRQLKKQLFLDAAPYAPRSAAAVS